MKAVLEIELIREDEYSFNRQLRPWVSRITGIDDQGRFLREFVQIARKDYSRANSKGSRGIFAYYVLSSGIYEVKQLRNWNSEQRRFIRVDEERIADISYKDVLEVIEIQIANERRADEWLRSIS